MKRLFLAAGHCLPVAICVTAVLLCACESSEESLWASKKERVEFVAKAEKTTTLRKFYEEYLAEWPEGQYSQSAGLRLERLDWTDAIVGGHIDDYLTYLARHPNGEHAPIARKIKAWGETTEAREIARHMRTIRIHVHDLGSENQSEYGNAAHQMSVLAGYLFRFVGMRVCSKSDCQPDADLKISVKYGRQSADYIDATSPSIQTPGKYLSGASVEGNFSLVTRDKSTLFESTFSAAAVPRQFVPGGRPQVTRSHLIYIGKQSLGATLVLDLTELYGPQLWLSYILNKGDLWYDKRWLIDAAIVAGVPDPYKAFKPRIEETLAELGEDITDVLLMDDHQKLLHWMVANKHITRDEFNEISDVCWNNELGCVMGYFTPDP